MPMPRRSWVLLLLLVGASLPLAANIVVPAEFKEIVDDSTLIARGTVTDVRAVAVPGAGIDTMATVAIQSMVKGDAAEFVTVRVPGGQLGTTRFVMVGAPTLRRGDRAVFLLKRGADNFWRPVGLSQGVYRVKVDASTGRGTVTPPILEGRTASVGPIVRGDPRRQPMPVEEFESLIRTVVLRRATRQGSGL